MTKSAATSASKAFEPFVVSLKALGIAPGTQPIPPVTLPSGEHVGWCCGICLRRVESGWKYCGACGEFIAWTAP